jgi:uncharacterized protein
MRSKSMRRLLIATSAIALSTGAAMAQTPGCGGRNLLDEIKASDAAGYAAIRKAADEVVNGKNLLWKIENTEKPNRGVSYLYGTIHVTDDRVQKFTPTVLEAFSSVRRVAVEVSDIRIPRLAEGMNTLRGSGKLLLDGQEKLDTLLSPSEAQVAMKAVSRIGLPPDVVSRVQPWVAHVMLSKSDCERSRMLGGKLPLDLDIAKRAEQRGMGTVDLETVESQFAMMASVPTQHQLALLKGQVALNSRLNDLTETMIQLYLARDLGAMWPVQAAIAKQAGVDEKAYESYRENVHVERTKRMRNRLAPHLDRGGVFIAVGAMHLPGATGLVAQIKDMGFKITPVE